MTNEDFLKIIAISYAGINLSFQEYNNLLEHAKKLVAVAEAAKGYYEDNCLAYNIKLNEALKELERE